MTTLRSTLRIPGFQQSLREALQPENIEDARRSLLRDMSRPEHLSEDDWLGVRTAVRLVYQTASQEGLDATLGDVRDAIGADLDESGYAALTELVTPTEQTDRRLTGTRLRDSLLPNLLGSSASLDLRVLDSELTDPMEVVPVALVRLDFDEHVAGQDAVSFQVSLPALDDLLSDLQTLRLKFDAVSGQHPPVVEVADWAKQEGVA